MARAYFIVRGFNKTQKDFKAWEEWFSPLSRACEKRGIPYTVLYSTSDKKPAVPPLRVPLTVVEVERWSWSLTLNSPIERLLSQTVPEKYASTPVIPLSFEVAVDKENATRIAEAIRRGERFLALRETPQWLDTDNPYSKSFPDTLLDFWNDVQKKDVEDILRDEKYLQTMCLVGRNTLAHYFLADFKEHGLFSAATDSSGGIEDWEFLLRSKPAFSRAVVYSDVRIKEEEPDEDVRKQQTEKLAREIEALKKILTLHRKKPYRR